MALLGGHDHVAIVRTYVVLGPEVELNAWHFFVTYQHVLVPPTEAIGRLARLV